MRLTRLLKLLIVFTLLLPAVPTQATPPASIIQEQVVETTPTPIVTPTPTGSLELAPYPTPFPTSEPIAYPTPLPASEPTGSPTPIASPESTAIPSAEPPTPSPTPEAISPAQLALLLSAPNSALIPGESVVLSWQVLDWRESLADLRLELNLSQAFTPGDGPAQIYDPQTGKLELPVHAAQGQLFLHSQADATGSFTIQASLRQGQAVIDHANYTYQEEGLNQVGRGGGQARGLNGKVTVDFPAEAAGEDLEVRVRRPASAHRPPHSLSGSPFEILASGKTSGQEHHHFQAPLTVTIDYDPAQFPSPESSLRLAYYDPEQAAWLPVESRVDLANHRLSAALDHLSVFDVSAGGWESARLPGMEGFQVAHFTGAASYSLPFWTPPGPGGLQPSLSLTYNSQVVDNARARYTQAGWVGMGWSLETGAIERDQHGTDGSGDDTFTLTAGGISSRLLLSADGYYHTVDESFWRIRYNSAQDSWTAWDGTGNQFIFGESDNARATYPLGMIDCAQANQNLTWRWSLSRQVNAYGKALSYTYTEEDQGKTSACDPDVQYPATLASYPASIQYPDSPYRIVFDLAVRNDYRPGWSSSGALTFYQRSRLQQIRIMDGSAELRRYVFSYAAADPIYPNINWDGNSKTLTLSAVQEFGLNNTALPATTFSYTDGLHLTAASNGYGGSAAYQYEGVPWHDLNKDERKSHTDEIGCEYDNQAEEWQPSNIFGYNGGSTWCETNAQGGNPQLYVNGSAYLDLPPALLQPAAIYTTLFSAYNKDLWDRPITVGVGLISEEGEHIAQEIANVADHTTISLEAPVRLPGTASTVRLYLYCSGKCTVLSAKVYLMSTRYRVEGQTLGDSTTNAVRPTTFRYDEAALNDAAHSARAASGGTLYTPPNSQFRGHAMSMALGADGQAATAFYHQDDARKGQVSLSIVTKEDYYAGFDNGGYDPLHWTVYNSAGLSVNRLLGDPALQVSAGSVWDGVNRSGYSLSDGEIALAQFRVDSAAVPFVAALESGQPGTGSYRRWGVFGGGDGRLYAQYHDGVAFYTPRVLFDAGDPQIQFQGGCWYGLILAVDDDGQFYTRVWRRDNPAVFAQYSQALTPGLSWHFVSYVKNGSVWLDSYQEGLLYRLSQYDYAVDTTAASAPWGFSDLAIDWVRPISQQELIFQGDGGWVGRREDYAYGGYGNRTRTVESEWAPGSGAWLGLRLAVTGYYPNPGNIYVVRLPGYRNIYRCAAGESSAACLINTPSNANSVASTWYLYDDQPWYSDPPVYGRPSGVRELVRSAVPPASDPRYRDEKWTFDAWGNRLTATVWNSEGTYSQHAALNPRVTSYTYDGAYHAYQLVETNPLGHTTTWTYNSACGLPASESGPNGSDTTITASYDNNCRLSAIIRPGDSSAYPTLQFSYSAGPPFMSEARQRLLAGGAPTSTQRKYYDGLGRLIQSQVVGAVLADNACSTDGDTNDDVCDAAVDYRYDASGRLVQQTQPYALASGGGAWRGQQLGQPSTFMNYDVLGRVMRTTAPDGTMTSLSYTDSGANAPDGYAYLEVRRTDALGRVAASRSDVFGRVRQVIPPLGPGVTYLYDVEDQLVQAARGGTTTTLSYDSGGRKLQIVDPDLGTWRYAYDAMGNLTRQTDARGQRVCLYYDSLNRLTGKHYRSDDACPGNPTLAVSYSYDAINPYLGQFGRGYRTGMSDASGNTSWTYDTRGRMAEEWRTVTGAGSFWTRWDYTSADLLASLVYPGGSGGETGETLTYAYHPQLALKSVASSTGYSYVPSISYDAAGRVDVRKLGALPTLQVDYDYFAWNTLNGLGRLKQIQAGPPGDPASLLDLRYFSGINTTAYDAVGNLLNIYDYKTGSPQTQSFQYDALDRLTSAAADGSTGAYAEGYTYDPATGNLASKGGVSYVYTAQVSNCQGTPATHTIAHAVSTAGGNTYGYDCNGNMTQRTTGAGTYNLSYDAENRLSEVSGAATATFVYDGDSKRVVGTVGGITTTYIGEYFEWTGSTTTMKKYYYAGGTRVAMREGAGSGTTGLNWLLSDHLGSTSVVANSSGGLQSRVLYKAWGEPRYASASLPTQYTFTGQYSYTDDITTPNVTEGFGLMFYNARWYDPSIMQFNQPDTLIPDPYNPLDWNRYLYARANPLKYSDPSGHIPVDIIVDLLFLAYDVGAILIEGPTPLNQAALAADAACAVIPYGTGGGLAVRLGGEAAIQGVTHLPAGVRALQAAEKLAQFAANSDPNSSAPSLSGQSNSTSPGSATTNSHGDPYPTIIDPRTGQPVQAPPDNLQIVPASQRVEWGPKQRGEFIKEWFDKGYQVPDGGWENYDIHHIIPRERGGTNAFNNLVPVSREYHQRTINPWWSGYQPR